MGGHCVFPVFVGVEQSLFKSFLSLDLSVLVLQLQRAELYWTFCLYPGTFTPCPGHMKQKEGPGDSVLCYEVPRGSVFCLSVFLFFVVVSSFHVVYMSQFVLFLTREIGEPMSTPSSWMQKLYHNLLIKNMVSFKDVKQLAKVYTTLHSIQVIEFKVPLPLCFSQLQYLK